MKDNKTDQKQTNEGIEHLQKTGNLNEQLMGLNNGENAVPHDRDKARKNEKKD